MNLYVDRFQLSLLIIKKIQGITSGKVPNSYVAKEHESHRSSSAFYENVDFTHPRYFLRLLHAEVLIFAGTSLWSLGFKQY